jgi:hypothetical protein
MTPRQFITKWQRVQLSERSASQQHLFYREDLENPPLLVVCDMDPSPNTKEQYEYRIR